MANPKFQVCTVQVKMQDEAWRSEKRGGDRALCSHPGEETGAGRVGLGLVGRLFVGGRNVDCASEPASLLKSMPGAKDLFKALHTQSGTQVEAQQLQSAKQSRCRQC